jgi:DNA-binding NtrC family response regulator
VCIVSASHRDLAARVAEGTFRGDLLYRLKDLVIRTPSFADRREDVPLLSRRLTPR